MGRRNELRSCSVLSPCTPCHYSRKLFMFRPTLRVYGSLSRRHHHHHHGWNLFFKWPGTHKKWFFLFKHFFLELFFLSFFFYWFFLLIWLLFFTSRRKKVSKSKRLRIFETLWSHSSRAWLFNFFFFHPQFRDWSSALLKSDWFSRKERKMFFFFFPTFLDAGGCRFSIHGH